jgi:hypothetical protein
VEPSCSIDAAVSSSALAQVLVALGDLGAGGGYTFGVAAHLPDDLDEAGLHRAHRFEQLAGFVAGADPQLAAEVALGDAAGGLQGFLHRPRDAARHGPGDEATARGSQAGQEQHQGAGGGDIFVGILLGLLGQRGLKLDEFFERLEVGTLRGAYILQQHVACFLVLVGHAQSDGFVHRGAVGGLPFGNVFHERAALLALDAVVELFQEVRIGRARLVDALLLCLHGRHVAQQRNVAHRAGDLVKVVLDVAQLIDLDHAVIGDPLQLGTDALQREAAVDCHR